jgi:signal transduction histidine kinase
LSKRFALPLRSIYGRLILWLVAVTFAAVLALALVADSAVRKARTDALAALVDADLTALADIYASGGKAELIARIEDRLALLPADGDAAHYLIGDARGRPLGDGRSEWPDLAAESSEAGYVVIDEGLRVYGRTTMLGPDLKLFVSREYASWESLRERLLTRLLAWGAAIALAVILLGVLAARRLRRRVAGINAAYEAVEGGELERRAPGAELEDELGILAGRANRMLTRIEALVRAHRNMSDHVAHELRTPLTHLDSTLIKLLGEDVGASGAERMSKAREEIRRVVRMLDAMLDISASEARRGDPSGLAPVDLTTVVDNLVDLYRESAAERGLRLEASIDPGIVFQGDEMLLSRMVSNLLDNAFKVVPSGGGVQVRLTAGPRIEVTDDGPGIPAEMRQRIFERFQRIPGGPGEGHGLGLALSRAIARRHGLDIRLVNGKRGACFRIEPEGNSG